MWDLFSFICGVVVGGLATFILISIYAWLRVKKLRNEFAKFGLKAPKDYKFPNEEVSHLGKVKSKKKAKKSGG